MHKHSIMVKIMEKKVFFYKKKKNANEFEFLRSPEAKLSFMKKFLDDHTVRN